MDFSPAALLVRPSTDSLGPYRFDFTAWLPPGRTIASATCRSFQGTAETTEFLVESSSNDGQAVDCHLQWPLDAGGAPLTGLHRLIFELTLDDGSGDEAWFDSVVVKPRTSKP